jgi:hypothetical protein
MDQANAQAARLRDSLEASEERCKDLENKLSEASKR